MFTTTQQIYAKIKKNLAAIFFFLFLFSFKLFEIENTFNWYAWGGLAVKMNPYNINSISIPKKMIITTKDLNQSEIKFNQFKYDLLFPLSIRGSFKYFYYRFPEVEEQVSSKICNFVRKEHSLEPDQIQIYSMNQNFKLVHKRYICK